jgi:hypothetical protein
MALLALLVKFAVVRRSPDAVHPLSSTLLDRAVRVVLVECGNCARPDIIRLSTEVCTTRC